LSVQCPLTMFLLREGRFQAAMGLQVSAPKKRNMLGLLQSTLLLLPSEAGQVTKTPIELEFVQHRVSFMVAEETRRKDEESRKKNEEERRQKEDIRKDNEDERNGRKQKLDDPSCHQRNQ